MPKQVAPLSLFNLTPAQVAFATWLAARSGAGATTRPSRQQQCAMWERLTGEALTLAQLKALRASAEFRAALREARGTAEVQIAEAQRLALGMYSTGMKAHARALKRADEAGDYKAVPALTENIWKRVLPVHTESAAPATVTINLTTERLAALAAPPVAVEVEELPLPPDVGPELP